MVHIRLDHDPLRAVTQPPEPVILFEGERVVAVDKPAGWLSVPSRLGAADPRPCAGRALEGRLGRLWPVHRLDEEATGVLVFARDARAHALLNGWFEARRVRKTYEALTEGDAEPFSATWTSRLHRGKRRTYESPHGKPSETRVTLHGRDARGLLAWTLEPVTGRPHQLRFELARHGHPIVGDTLYGARTRLAGGGIALRCVRLRFPDDEARAAGVPPELEAPSLASWMAGRILEVA